MGPEQLAPLGPRCLNELNAALRINMAAAIDGAEISEQPKAAMKVAT